MRVTTQVGNMGLLGSARSATLGFTPPQMIILIRRVDGHVPHSEESKLFCGM
jgi:hypothetical protein